MPFITVRLAGEPISVEKKQQVIAEITETMVRVLDKNPATTMVLIEENAPDNWGIGGETVTVRRAKAAAANK